MLVRLVGARVNWLTGLVNVIVQENEQEKILTVTEFYAVLNEQERVIFDVAMAAGMLNKAPKKTTLNAS